MRRTLVTQLTRKDLRKLGREREQGQRILSVGRYELHARDLGVVERELVKRRSVLALEADVALQEKGCGVVEAEELFEEEGERSAPSTQ